MLQIVEEYEREGGMFEAGLKTMVTVVHKKSSLADLFKVKGMNKDSLYY